VENIPGRTLHGIDAPFFIDPPFFFFTLLKSLPEWSFILDNSLSRYST
jgi:hypothetical protein